MSSIATMYSFSRQFGLKYYVTQDQYDLLTYYFQPSTLDLAVVDVALANLSSLGVDLLKIFQHSQCRVMLLYYYMLGISHLHWEKPWLPLEGKDMQFNYQRMEEPSLHTGRLLNMGDYPNEVRYYAPFLPAIRSMFTFRPRFPARAQTQLRGELARRGLASEEVTWVGVHNRRSSDASLIHIASF